MAKPCPKSVRETFARISGQHPIRIKKILGWRVGDSPEHNVPENPDRDDIIYYLPLEIENAEDIVYIKFLRRQFDDCANSAETGRRFDVERYIHKQLDFLVSR